VRLDRHYQSAFNIFILTIIFIDSRNKTKYCLHIQLFLGVNPMAVVTLFMSDRDTSKTFTSKKEADEYDKMLELAEAVSYFVEQNIEGLDEKQVENIGLLFARQKELLAQALKGKTEALFNSQQENQSEADTI